MYFHICETKVLNRWKLVSHYEKGKEGGGGGGGGGGDEGEVGEGEREKGRERR